MRRTSDLGAPATEASRRQKRSPRRSASVGLVPPVPTPSAAAATATALRARAGARRHAAWTVDGAAQASLEASLAAAVASFDSLATAAGLPWLDRLLYKNALLDAARVTALPRVTRLCALLDATAEASQRVRASSAARDETLREIQWGTCAFEGSGHPCSVALHARLAALLKRHDAESDAVVAALGAWRAGLARPLPFHVSGENCLLRMAAQCGVGGAVGHANAHLRATSRHLSFHYSSAYDAAAAASLRISSPQLRLVLGEAETQLALCREQLGLAQMGVYVPVLRFAWSAGAAASAAGSSAFGKPGDESGAFTMPGLTVAACGVVTVTNKAWKALLVSSYSSALEMLARHRPRFGGALETKAAPWAVASAQFATISVRALLLRYWRVWFNFSDARGLRRRKAAGLAAFNAAAARRTRFDAWAAWAVRLRALKETARRVERAVTALVLGRYMAAWFKFWALARTSGQFRRALSLRYFHRWLYLVFRHRAWLALNDAGVLALAAASDALGLQPVVAVSNASTNTNVNATGVKEASRRGSKAAPSQPPRSPLAASASLVVPPQRSLRSGSTVAPATTATASPLLSASLSLSLPLSPALSVSFPNSAVVVHASSTAPAPTPQSQGPPLRYLLLVSVADPAAARAAAAVRAMVTVQQPFLRLVWAEEAARAAHCAAESAETAAAVAAAFFDRCAAFAAAAEARMAAVRGSGVADAARAFLRTREATARGACEAAERVGRAEAAARLRLLRLNAAARAEARARAEAERAAWAFFGEHRWLRETSFAVVGRSRLEAREARARAGLVAERAAGVLLATPADALLSAKGSSSRPRDDDAARAVWLSPTASYFVAKLRETAQQQRVATLVALTAEGNASDVTGRSPNISALAQEVVVRCVGDAERRER